MKKRENVFCIYFLVFFLMFILASCAGMQPEPEKIKIKYIVPPEADVTGFQYYLDEKCKMKVAKKPCLTFKITVKNVSDKPHRYAVRVLLPDIGKGTGGLVPVTGVKDKVTKKKGPAVIMPGKEKTVIYPMFHYEIPKRMEVEVKVMK